MKRAVVFRNHHLSPLVPSGLFPTQELQYYYLHNIEIPIPFLKRKSKNTMGASKGALGLTDHLVKPSRAQLGIYI
jgi:hypothetical protein